MKNQNTKYQEENPLINIFNVLTLGLFKNYDDKSFMNFLKTIIGSCIALFGVFLLVYFYGDNTTNLDVALGYLNDIKDFGIKSYTNVRIYGFSFDIFIYIYKAFLIMFINPKAMIFVYVGLIMKQNKGSMFKKVLKLTSFAMLLFGSAIFISLAINQ